VNNKWIVLNWSFKIGSIKVRHAIHHWNRTNVRLSQPIIDRNERNIRWSKCAKIIFEVKNKYATFWLINWSLVMTCCKFFFCVDIVHAQIWFPGIIKVDSMYCWLPSVFPKYIYFFLSFKDNVKLMKILGLNDNKSFIKKLQYGYIYEMSVKISLFLWINYNILSVR